MMCLAPIRASLALLGLNVFSDHIISPISAVNTPYCSRITIGIPLYVLFRVFVFIYLFCCFVNCPASGGSSRVGWLRLSDLLRFVIRVCGSERPAHANFGNEDFRIIRQNDVTASASAVPSLPEGLEFS